MAQHKPVRRLATFGDVVLSACLLATFLLTACDPNPTPWPQATAMPSGEPAPQPAGWADYCRREGDQACVK